MPGNRSKSSVGGILNSVKEENEETQVRAVWSPLQEIDSPRLVLLLKLSLFSDYEPTNVLIVHLFFMMEEV